MAVELVYGLHAVRSLLTRKPETVLELWIQQGRDDDSLRTLASLACNAGIAVQTVGRKTIDKRCPDATHQGVLARCRRQCNQAPDLGGFVDSLDSSSIILVLDAVQDPRNLGACLRSADAAGVAGVVISKNRSAPLSPAARKAAAGAAETVQVIEVSNLARALETLSAAGVTVIGTAGDAALSLFEQAFETPVAFVLGGEEKGLRRLTRERCDALVRIPMYGSVESLNVSVATGICLFEGRRRLYG